MVKSAPGDDTGSTMEFSGATVLTLGDVMLDRFAYCRLERISPAASGAVHVGSARARGVFDVAGAGETVRAIAAGHARPDAKRLANTALIAGVGSVDAVLSVADDTPLELIHRPKPDVLMKAADYRVETMAGAEDVIASGGRVALIDLVEGQSTSKATGRLQAPAKVG